MGAFAKAMNTTTGAAVEVFSHPDKHVPVIAQGRRHPNISIEEIPAPIDVGDKTGDLDAEEADLLSVCERAIDEYEEAERVAVRALQNIRDRRLYRTTHATFEDYIQERFGHGRLWANRQIESLQVSEVVVPGGTKLIPTKHSREVAPTLRELGPAAARDQYEKTASTGAVTGERLRANRPKNGPVEHKTNTDPTSPIAAFQAGNRSLASVRNTVKQLRADLVNDLPKLEEAGALGVSPRQGRLRDLRALQRDIEAMIDALS